MSAEPTHAHEHGEEHASMTKKKIWQVALILTLITAVEFMVALVLVPHNVIPLHVANPIYIVLTLAKAFYIVAYFMHLKFEKVGLVYSIVVPVIFIVGLILVLTNESHHWVDLRII
ncbi:cytochrome C oxidase subunit IV family protein [Mucilaginibacter sp. KACC 22063]|uniref:cytochrome C oxidase subunit IV family protein n=1 Tax=Mucilaginibacter sp. KACC 22063 TaxID=3025666 RepID=UPI0023651322|nr:cytochrome C oxidase subunit IV family protein [Mucilaginibacter sp. KACC 22063]WDF56294.1 cytochrome C oxidase subunit IV family protein [Mucilaginibacter sp. KACC 22063]